MKSRAFLVGCLFAASLGCGANTGSPDKVIVSGTVTFDAAPVTNGQILFFPIEGTKGAASGASLVDGTFTVTGKGGVPYGKHRVEIRAAKPGPGGVDAQYIPRQYNDASTLTAEVTPETEKLDFALTSQ
jgi:hypothetical protein